MYSALNKRKSVADEKPIRALQNKIYKYMTLISENVYIDKLNDIVEKYKNTYNRTMKMRPVDVKSSTYIDFDVENSDKDPEEILERFMKNNCKRQIKQSLELKKH